MNRGFFKIWRKIEDSASWNRGLMYQGLIVNLLNRANWKPAFFQGRGLCPGQFAMSMTNLSASLGIPRTTLNRMVDHLAADDFIKVENVGNRFCIFTIINWHSYQQQKEERGQPEVNRRSTNGQPVDRSKEEKKEEYIYTPPTPPQKAEPVSPEPPGGVGGSFSEHEDGGPKKTDCPSKGHPEWKAFLSCYAVYPVQQGQEEAWREWMRLKRNGTLAAAWEIRDAILRLSAEDSRWLRGKVPKMAKWLNGKGWNDAPYVEPGEAPAGAQREPPPKTEADKRREWEEFEALTRQWREREKNQAQGGAP